MRRDSGWIWLGLGIVLFVGSFAFTYARLLPGHDIGGNAEERLAAGAYMTLRHILGDGRRGAEVSSVIPDDLVGATLSDLRRREPSWSVVRFTADELVAEVRCASSLDGGFLGEKDGWVAVFDGQPGACSVLREITDIPLESVRASERDRLQVGIPFADDDERQQLIDGLVGD